MCIESIDPCAGADESDLVELSVVSLLAASGDSVFFEMWAKERLAKGSTK